MAVKVIQLELGDGQYAIVDTDFPQGLRDLSWHVTSKGYVETIPPRDWKVPNRYVRLHRILLSVTPDQHVDHINGDKLDNRKSNLRVCTNRENMMNKPARSVSGFKGVTKAPGKRNGYEVSIRENGRSKYLGYFLDPVEAAKAYDLAAKKNHGEFAWLNFPEKKDEKIVVVDTIKKPLKRQPNPARSGFRWVSFQGSSGKYIARRRYQGKDIYAGYFDDPEIASKALAELMEGIVQ